MSTGLPIKETVKPVQVKPVQVKPSTVVLSIPDPVNPKAIKQIVTVGEQDIIVPIGQKDICVEILPMTVVSICSVDVNGFRTQPLPLK